MPTHLVRSGKESVSLTASIKVPSTTARPVTSGTISAGLIIGRGTVGKPPKPDYLGDPKRELDYVVYQAKTHLEDSGWRWLGARFNSKLISVLKSERVESGYTHSAEQIIEDALTSYQQLAVEWIKDLVELSFDTQAWLAADILTCLGRLDRKFVNSWGFLLAIKALPNIDIEVRDAAVGALELWGGEEAINILRNYTADEKTPWLANYINQVISDLSE